MMNDLFELAWYTSDHGELLLQLQSPTGGLDSETIRLFNLTITGQPQVLMVFEQSSPDSTALPMVDFEHLQGAFSLALAASLALPKATL